MKKIFALLFLLCALSARSQVTTATLVITNGTTNGMTITINGNQRYFTNNVTSSLNQILTNSTLPGVQSNIFAAYGIAGETGVQLKEVGTNQINFQSYPGSSLTASVGSGWATMSLSTNNNTNFATMRTPLYGSPVTQLGPTERSNIEAGIIGFMNDGLAGATVAGNAAVMANFAALAYANTLTASNAFRGGISANAATITNAGLLNPTLTNGQNFGLPFRSPGPGIGSEQYGIESSALQAGDSAIGDNAYANGPNASAFGYFANAGSTYAVAIGPAGAGLPYSVAIGAQSGVTGTGTNGIAIGLEAGVSALDGIAIGENNNVNYAYSTGLGYNASPTGTNQIMLGTSAEYVQMPGNLNLVGVISNITVAGITTTGSRNNIFGTFNLQSSSSSSLVNGNNADVATGTNTFVYMSGPSGTFTNVGFAGGYPNREIKLVNISGQASALVHLSGLESTSTNRIFLGANHTSGDVYAFTNMAFLWYDATSNYWRLETQ